MARRYLHSFSTPRILSQDPEACALIALSFSLGEDRSRAGPFLLGSDVVSSGAAAVVCPLLLGCFSYVLCFASKVSNELV